MKKQLLILAIALFAIGMTTAYGQAVPGSIPRPISCVDDALHPIAGKPYDYSVTVNPTGGNYKWVATKNSSFISTAGGVTTILPDSIKVGSGLVAASTNYGDVTATDKVSITWSDALLANTVYNSNPTFVAVHYSGVTCADNMKVYQIDPIMAFIVDIKNIDDANKAILNYDEAEAQCISNMTGATFSGGSMLYNYGADTMYFEVVAANFTGSWTPTFTLTGLNAVQTSTIEWTYEKPSTPWSASTVWHPATDVVSTTETNTSAGVSIYVRLIIVNNNFEGIAAETVKLAVDGQNSLGKWDVVNATCTTTTGADQADFALQTLNPRPAITPGTTSPIAPNTTLISGNEQN